MLRKHLKQPPPSQPLHRPLISAKVPQPPISPSSRRSISLIPDPLITFGHGFMLKSTLQFKRSCTAQLGERPDGVEDSGYLFKQGGGASRREEAVKEGSGVKEASRSLSQSIMEGTPGKKKAVQVKVSIKGVKKDPSPRVLLRNAKEISINPGVGNEKTEKNDRPSLAMLSKVLASMTIQLPQCPPTPTAPLSTSPKHASYTATAPLSLGTTLRMHRVSLPAHSYLPIIISLENRQLPVQIEYSERGPADQHWTISVCLAPGMVEKNSRRGQTVGQEEFVEDLYNRDGNLTIDAMYESRLSYKRRIAVRIQAQTALFGYLNITLTDKYKKTDRLRAWREEYGNSRHNPTEEGQGRYRINYKEYYSIDIDTSIRDRGENKQKKNSRDSRGHYGSFMSVHDTISDVEDSLMNDSIEESQESVKKSRLQKSIHNLMKGMFRNTDSAHTIPDQVIQTFDQRKLPSSINNNNSTSTNNAHITTVTDRRNLISALIRKEREGRVDRHLKRREREWIATEILMQRLVESGKKNTWARLFTLVRLLREVKCLVILKRQEQIFIVNKRKMMERVRSIMAVWVERARNLQSGGDAGRGANGVHFCAALVREHVQNKAIEVIRKFFALNIVPARLNIQIYEKVKYGVKLVERWKNHMKVKSSMRVGFIKMVEAVAKLLKSEFSDEDIIINANWRNINHQTLKLIFEATFNQSLLSYMQKQTQMMTQKLANKNVRTDLKLQYFMRYDKILSFAATHSSIDSRDLRNFLDLANSNLMNFKYIEFTREERRLITKLDYKAVPSWMYVFRCPLLPDIRLSRGDALGSILSFRLRLPMAFFINLVLTLVNFEFD